MARTNETHLELYETRKTTRRYRLLEKNLLFVCLFSLYIYYYCVIKKMISQRNVELPRWYNQ